MADEVLPLARKYRPATFGDLAGQRIARILLYRILHTVQDGQDVPVASPRVPSGMLFTGGRGSGKTSTARIVAAALNCASAGIRPCAECESCKAVREGTHPSVIEVDAASNGTVDQVRRLQELAAYATLPGNHRVVILDEAHSMSAAAFNALLKLLEEPPPRTLFILVTTEAGSILKTVASRCMLFTFRRITPAEMAARLRKVATAEGMDVEDELLGHFATQADGALRDALNLLEQAHAVRARTLAQWLQLSGERDHGPGLLLPIAQGDPGAALARAGNFMRGHGDARLAVRSMAECLRDVLILHSGGTVAVQGVWLDARVKLTTMLSVAQCVAALKVLWQVGSLSGQDAQSRFELAMVMCCEAVKPQPAVSSAASSSFVTAAHNGNGTGHASVADLAAVLGGKA